MRHLRPLILTLSACFSSAAFAAPSEPVWEPITAPRDGQINMFYSPSTARTETVPGTNTKLRAVDVKFEGAGALLLQTWKIKQGACLGERVDWEVHAEGQPVRIQPQVSVKDNAMAKAMCGLLVHF